jgi:hypothetical protein
MRDSAVAQLAALAHSPDLKEIDAKTAMGEGANFMSN